MEMFMFVKHFIAKVFFFPKLIDETKLKDNILLQTGFDKIDT